jgi:hypothetical protein
VWGIIDLTAKMKQIVSVGSISFLSAENIKKNLKSRNVKCGFKCVSDLI